MQIPHRAPEHLEAEKGRRCLQADQTIHPPCTPLEQLRRAALGSLRHPPEFVSNSIVMKGIT